MLWIKKSDGAISIFLCIIMTAMIVLSGLLVDGARVRTGQTQVQEAVNISAGSALAGYDKILKDVYGIFAIAQGDESSLNQEIEKYLNRTLMTELGISKNNIDKEAFSYLLSIFTAKGDLEAANFLNLFDYRVEELKVTPLYNLSEAAVLKGQIVEFMKYRAPKDLLAGGLIDKLQSFRSISKQSDAMKKKVEADKKLGGIRELQEKLTSEIKEVNKFNESTFDGSYNEYINQLSLMVSQMEQSISIKKSIEQLKVDIEDMNKQIDSVQTKIDAAKKDKEDISLLEKSLSDLKGSKSELEDKHSELDKEYSQTSANLLNHKNNAAQLIEALKEKLKTAEKYNNNAAESIDDITEKSGEAVKKFTEIESTLKNDNTDFANKIKAEAITKKEQLDPEKLKPIKIELENNSNLTKAYIKLIDYIDYEKITLDGVEAAINSGASGSSAIIHKITNKTIKSWSNLKSDNNQTASYKSIDNFKGVEPVKKDTSSMDADIRKVAKDKAASSDNPVKAEETKAKEEEKNTDASFNPKELPSYKDGKIKSRDFSKEDKAYISSIYKTIISSTGESLSENTEINEQNIRKLMENVEFNDNNDSPGFSEKAFELVSAMFSSIGEKLEDSRDNLYVNEYAMGMFNNALTIGAVNGKEGEYDLRERLKADKVSYFDKSEAEYILAGMRSASANRAAVQGQILLVRFAMNTMHIYMDTVKSRQALVAATSIAGWTGFGVPIVQTLIMLSWSMAESIYDVKQLIDGKKVALMKNNDTWSTSINGGIQQAAHSLADYTVDEAQDIAKYATKRIDEIANEKIMVAINKEFAQLEAAIEKDEKNLNDLLNTGSDYLAQKMEEQGSNSMNDLHRQIYDEVAEVFNSKRAEIGNIAGQTIDKAKEAISEIKASISAEVKARIKSYIAKINEEIDKSAAEGKEKLHEYIDSLEGSKNQTKINDIKGSLLSLSYQDYLRVFLFIKNDSQKLGRIGDLMQLNMRKQTNNDKFKIAECNTYIRVDVNVSMRYFFMTQPFVSKYTKTPDGSRHQLRTVLYQGY